MALHYRRHRSSILMISSGIDYFRGGFDPLILIWTAPSSAPRKKTLTCGPFIILARAMSPWFLPRLQLAVQSQQSSPKKLARNLLFVFWAPGVAQTVL